ncbi:mechanosensitive ion channel [Candidatus Bathyarchaeota archaeon]|nr:mechanosensitive ion channel [Candidatus Bathyarchaeota archaeon]
MGTDISVEEIQARIRRSVTRTIWYTFICAFLLLTSNLLFKTVIGRFFPLFLEYEIYVNVVIILGLGYLIINSTSNVIYWAIRRRLDHAMATLFRTTMRIVGIATLLAVLTSVFNINPATALTIGSFTGMVIGFATQTVLGQAVAGMFLVLLRPFKPGDVITVVGQRGIVNTASRVA